MRLRLPPFLDRLRARKESRPAPEGHLDRWLLRLSHIAQFGIFLITVGALYFTVLPLYQKALLEEAIAKREIELKNVTAELDKAYGQLRQAVVRQYVSYAGAKCSGLLDKIELPGITIVPKGSVEELKRKGVVERPSNEDANRIFGIEVGKCFREAAMGSPQLEDLKTEDREYLFVQFDKADARLRLVREQAMHEHSTVEARARKDPSSVPAPTGMVGRWLDVQEKYYIGLQRAQVSGRPIEPEVPFAEMRLREAILQEQRQVVARYADKIRNEAMGFRSLVWPVRK